LSREAGGYGVLHARPFRIFLFWLPGGRIVQRCVQAVNLFTITKYSGLDPELGDYEGNAFGIDNGNYPNVRQVSFGLQLKI